MNRPLVTYFLVAVPLALAMVLALVLFSGRMKPETRTGVERVMAAIFYPVATFYWLWRAAEFLGEGSLLKSGAMAIVAAVFIALGFKAIRSRRRAPGSKVGG